MEGEDDLEILASLLAETEPVDELDQLFDGDDEGEQEYEEACPEHSGNTACTEEQGKDDDKLHSGPDKSSEDLAAELSRMQEHMCRLQQQLEAKRASQNETLPPPHRGQGESLVIKQDEERAKPANKAKPAGTADSNGRIGSTPRRPMSSAAQNPVRQDAPVEKFSGLRLRRPRVSSSEMEQKMSGRRLIRLSQLPERLSREKLDDIDWVTFAVVVSKITPQSSTSGKTFSIWKLNDLSSLDVYVSLFLFGEVHKEHWKTDTGTVIGILNANPMKPKEGSNEVCLSVDHPQKILLMGEAQDFGFCKATKKNGEPCTQLVNLYECQYCQYHVKAQYKKMSSKRAELQSTFSGKVPGKARGRGGCGLKERLCHSGFYYGGVSSAACVPMLASNPKKPTQSTLNNLFVKGSDQLVNRAKTLAISCGQVSGCSEDFRELLTMPTPGALNLKKHLTHSHPAGVSGAGVQSIPASQLLKQQKRHILQARQQRREELQQRFLHTSEEQRRESTAPKLGRGFTRGEDILFFDHTPPSPASSLSAAKMAALQKLRMKGATIGKEDPNAVKRKRSSMADISYRVQTNMQAAERMEEPNTEPAVKKRREQLDYLQSDEFQQILNAKSRHVGTLQAAEIQMQAQYFEPLVKKEQLEEKMRSIREMKCRAVTCKTCNYTYFKPLEKCVEEKHDYHWHNALKRFFKCPCGQRAISLDRLPHKHCSNCGLFKWQRDGMLKEKSGPKIGGELLLPRGEEQPKFLSSLK